MAFDCTEIPEFEDGQLVQINSTETNLPVIGRIVWDKSDYQTTFKPALYIYCIQIFNQTYISRRLAADIYPVETQFITPEVMHHLTTKEILQLVKINRT